MCVSSLTFPRLCLVWGLGLPGAQTLRKVSPLFGSTRHMTPFLSQGNSLPTAAAGSLGLCSVVRTVWGLKKCPRDTCCSGEAWHRPISCPGLAFCTVGRVQDRKKGRRKNILGEDKLV